ncbi:MAG: CdiI family contact-dependent growth inhibition immunity protein [Burkholderiales bacterium]|nr:CdiI family contact-dependent growth inhibition immunity protein [Burkholderiales bacterium]
MGNLFGYANISFNQVFFNVVTYSHGMMGYGEPDAPHIYLAPDVDNATLGKALRQAMKLSKKVSVEEFQKIWHSGVVPKKAKEQAEYAIKTYGFKNHRTMVKKMDSCSFCIVEGQIEIQAAHHYALNNYTYEVEPFYVSINVSDEELGAAIRVGFSQCTSKLK